MGGGLIDDGPMKDGPMNEGRADDGVAIVVQARMSSERLPGKVLRPLAGAPAIVRMFERLARVRRARHRILATSDEASDDPLAKVAEAEGIAVYRGSLDDVLGRVLAAMPPDCDTLVRLTGDCPLIDPVTVDRHIGEFQQGRPAVDYVTNAVTRSQPDGLDVEVVSRSILETANAEATSSHDREHVTPWIGRHARTVAITQAVDLSPLRWTLDTEADYQNISALYDSLYPASPDFDAEAVYALLVRRPELIRLADDEHEKAERRAYWASRIAEHLRGKQVETTP
jgi:spore coat polysaccharide biosynthesis protein SpsF